MPTGHSPSPLMHQRYAVFRLLKAISITTGQPVMVSRDETITVPGLGCHIELLIDDELESFWFEIPALIAVPDLDRGHAAHHAIQEAQQRFPGNSAGIRNKQVFARSTLAFPDWNGNMVAEVNGAVLQLVQFAHDLQRQYCDFYQADTSQLLPLGGPPPTPPYPLKPGQAEVEPPPQLKLPENFSLQARLPPYLSQLSNAPGFGLQRDATLLAKRFCAEHNGATPPGPRLVQESLQVRVELPLIADCKRLSPTQWSTLISRAESLAFRFSQSMWHNRHYFTKDDGSSGGGRRRDD